MQSMHQLESGRGRAEFQEGWIKRFKTWVMARTGALTLVLAKKSVHSRIARSTSG
jgi:hypothetical protein